MRSHEKTDLKKCDYCEEKFLKLNLLLAHITEKHKENEKIFRFLNLYLIYSEKIISHICLFFYNLQMQL